MVAVTAVAKAAASTVAAMVDRVVVGKGVAATAAAIVR